MNRTASRCHLLILDWPPPGASSILSRSLKPQFPPTWPLYDTTQEPKIRRHFFSLCVLLTTTANTSKSLPFLISSPNLIATCRPWCCCCCWSSLFWWLAFLKTSRSSSEPEGRELQSAASKAFWFFVLFSFSYLRGACRGEWCPPWHRCPRSLCWSSGPQTLWCWPWMCCRPSSASWWWHRRLPQRRQRGRRIWGAAPPLWWPLLGPDRSSTHLTWASDRVTLMTLLLIWKISLVVLVGRFGYLRSFPEVWGHWPATHQNLISGQVWSSSFPPSSDNSYTHNSRFLCAS